LLPFQSADLFFETGAGEGYIALALFLEHSMSPRIVAQSVYKIQTAIVSSFAVIALWCCLRWTKLNQPKRRLRRSKRKLIELLRSTRGRT